MGKRIIITSGPTNEAIDSVMQITNMSTGALGCRVANYILSEPALFDDIEKVYYVSPKLAYKPENHWGDKLEFIMVSSTDSLLNVLTELLTREHIDAVVHSAAVGDYKGRYAARAEDLAAEIARVIADNKADAMTKDDLYSTALQVLTNPACVQDNSTKISSYEPNLMVMLDLTPKVIRQIKKLSPSTMLIGFKLLSGVTDPHLFKIGSNLLDTTEADYIVANDLARIGNGRHWAMVIGRDTIVGRNAVVSECETKDDIARVIADCIFWNILHGNVVVTGNESASD